MAGKAYTMQEMRDIVIYLVQQGAYSEIRARSMWVNFANSGRTTRTWQSLKETFLKRILPDIHNPYYQLTRDQISSFRAGTDIAKRSVNKLQFQEMPNTSKVLENVNASNVDISLENAAKGEDPENRKTSTETMVLDTTEEFAVAEEVIHSLEAKTNVVSPSKSLKDMIIFAEPLTPMMNVLADWESDSNHSDTSVPKVTNTAATTSTTCAVTPDTLLPNNQEINSEPVGDPQSIPSISVNTQSAIENSKVNNYIKSALKQNNTKSSDTEEPVKKKVRLSDTSEETGRTKSSKCGTVSDNSNSIDNINTTRQKLTKDNTKTVDELFALLAESVLPANQEGLQVLKKFLTDKSLKNVDEKGSDDTQSQNIEANAMSSSEQSMKNNRKTLMKKSAKIGKLKKSKLKPSDSKEINSRENEILSNKSIEVPLNDDLDKSEQMSGKRITRNAKKNKSNQNAESDTDSSSRVAKTDDKHLNELNTSQQQINKNDRKHLNESSEITENISTRNHKKARSVTPRKVYSESIVTPSDNEINQIKNVTTKRITRATNKTEILSDSSGNLDSNQSVSDGRREKKVNSIKTATAIEQIPQSDNTEIKSLNLEILTNKFQDSSQQITLDNTSSQTESQNEDKEASLPNEGNTIAKKSPKRANRSKSASKEIPSVSKILEELPSVHEVHGSLNSSHDMSEKSPKKSTDNESAVKIIRDISKINEKSTSIQDINKPVDASNKIKHKSPKKVADNKADTETTEVGLKERENTTTVNDGVCEPHQQVSKSSENTDFFTATNSTHSDLPLSNPCLQSVSLFEENEKHILENSQKSCHSEKPVEDSGMRKSPSKKGKSPIKTQQNESKKLDVAGPSKQTNRNSVVLLPSHSSSSNASTECLEPVRRTHHIGSKLLPKLFGFCDGDLRNRQRQYARRKCEKKYTRISSGSGSGDSSDEDLVPLPRQGNTLRYIRRPACGRVRLRDGELVAVCGGRVYGLVAQRGRRVYTLQYMPDEKAREHHEEPARVSSSSPIPQQPTRRDGERRLSGASATSAATATTAAPPGAQTCITLTKDKITLAGDVDKILAMLPQLTQAMQGLSDPAKTKEVGAQAKEVDGASDIAAAAGEAARTSKRASAANVASVDAEKRTSVDQRNINLDDEQIRLRVDELEEQIFREIKNRQADDQTSAQTRRQPAANQPPQRLSLRRKRAPQKEFPPRSAPASSGSGSDTEIIINEEPRRRRGRPRVNKAPKMATPESDDSLTLYSLPSSAKPTSKLRDVLLSNLSMESTQGYQDSDYSFIEIKPKRRRKTSYQVELARRRSVSVARQKRSHGRSNTLRRNIATLRNSSSGDEVDKKKADNLPLDSIVAKNVNNSPRLTPIPESLGSDEPSLVEDAPSDSKLQGNSSNVSLPPSPEISIVEHVSVKHSSIELNDTEYGENCNSDMILIKNSAKHVSLVGNETQFSSPLMEQDLAVTRTKTVSKSGNISNRSSVEEMEICVTTFEDGVDKIEGHPTVTDSLLSKVTDVKINETSESMQNGMDNLKIVSATMMDLGSPNVLSPKPVSRLVGRSKSRCSTPNKKAKIRKSQPPMIGSVPEEEHVECCSRKRRESCPGTIQYGPDVIIQMDTPQYAITVPNIVVSKTEEVVLNKWKIRTPRRPKPKIIKVKIQKPKKSPESSPKPKRVQTRKGKRATIDGVQNAEMQKQESALLDISNLSNGDLIHNHSDSCLAASECAMDSMISEDYASDSGLALQHYSLTPSPDCFSSDARDATASTATASHSSEGLTLSNLGGLLTELPSPTASWYLLSEEEEDLQDLQSEERELARKYGKHIAQLYPLTCAVPHLSTITEASDTRSSAGQTDIDSQGPRMIDH